MSKWKCEICGAEFENFHAQGFDNKIYCPLCYFKKENQELKKQLHEASIEIQSLIEENMSCPSSCSKIEELKSQKQEWVDLLDKFKTQQKEFIEWLEKEKNIYESLQIMALETLKHILSKYKEIIGVKDE